ncbi:MAG: CsgG/HfaB family protein [Acidobacteriota bacterium]
MSVYTRCRPTLLLLFACALLGSVAPLTVSAGDFAGKQPKKRVAIATFANESGYHKYKEGNLGGGLTEKLGEALIDTGKFVLLERGRLQDVVDEHKLGDVARVEPAVVGRLTSAQALLRGVITNIDVPEEQKGGMRIKGFWVGSGFKRVTVTLNLNLTDTTTGQILQSKTVTGKAWQRKLRVRKSGDADIELRRDDTVAKALDDAIREATTLIVAGMEKMPWQGSVSRVSGRRIIVNAGSDANVETGLVLRVYERGASIIDQETNEDLGRLDEEIGMIRIVEVSPKFSIAESVQGQGFAKGNIVRPMSG